MKSCHQHHHNARLQLLVAVIMSVILDKNMCENPGDKIEIPGDCTRYFLCTDQDDSKISITSCPAGEVFNPFIGDCDSPQNTPHCDCK